MRRIIASLLFTIPLFSAGAIQLNCIAVGAAGDVTISWQNSSSSAIFRSYHIYHAQIGAGPYSLLDSITSYANQLYTDPAASANTTDAYYYVELNNVNGTTAISDTLRAIRLNVIDPADGHASLLWNATHSPPLNSNADYYLIYKEYPAGVFTLIDSLDVTAPILNYQDEISICGDTVNYRIELSDGSGCKSVSSIDGDYFVDRIAPVTPVVDSVSIDANGNAVVGWTQSTSGDTYSYIVYQTDGTSATPIDTLYGAGNTYYQSSLNATTGSQGFRIVAVDSCGNPCGADPLQRTLYLEGSIDRCSSSIHLMWNAYVNSLSAPVYQILMTENGGGEILAGSTGQTDFTVTNLKTDTLYCFQIVAILNADMATSTSNAVCVTPDLPVAPQYAYISSVSVFPNNVVTVTAYVDPGADIREYQLQRADAGMGNFVTVGTQSFSAAPQITFIDEVSTEEKHYYRVASIDSCGNDALQSQVSCNIVLKMNDKENFNNVIAWNSYRQWPGGVSHYLIYRGIDGFYDPSPFAFLPANDSLFSDDVRDLFSTQGDFCYYLVAYEAPGNPYGFSDSARSNEICIQQQSGVYIPNAFRPEGQNKIFNPAEYFIGLDGYSLQIFNRFGEQIFKTERPETGWDGTSKGHLCEMGVYVYRFKALDEKGQDIEKVGRVTLIR